MEAVNFFTTRLGLAQFIVIAALRRGAERAP
jgi:hypothetical protein